MSVTALDLIEETNRCFENVGPYTGFRKRNRKGKSTDATTDDSEAEVFAVLGAGGCHNDGALLMRGEAGEELSRARACSQTLYSPVGVGSLRSSLQELRSAKGPHPTCIRTSYRLPGSGL